MNTDEVMEEDYLYVVYSGVVACITYTVNGEINCHALIGEGHTANEMSLFSNYDLSWAVIAMTDVTLCKIRSRDVEQLIFYDREVIPRLFKAVFDNMTAVNAYSNMLMMRSVYERIREFLLLFARCLGRDGNQVKITLTHNELACLIKANRVTVTKTLKQLEDEGFIERGNKSIILHLDRITIK